MRKISWYIESGMYELSLCDRVRAAKDMGFDAIDIWEPDKIDCHAVAKTAQQVGIPITGTLMQSGLTRRLDEPRDIFMQNMRESIEYAKILGANMFVGLAGDISDSTGCFQMTVLTENLKRAAELLDQNGMRMAVEALNTYVDHKGYYLDSPYKALELVHRVNAPSVKMVFDCYHVQIMEGNLIPTITRNIDDIIFLHAANVPGRVALDQGEIHYPAIMKALDALGYDGYMALEFIPADRAGLERSLALLKE